MTKLKCCIASLTFATVVGAFQQLNVYRRFGWLSSPGPSQFSYRVLPSRRFQSLSTGYTANNRSPTAQELTDDFEVFLQQQQLRRALRQSEVFQDIDNIELERIVQICELQEYPPNATIFEKGDEGDGMYIVKSGTIEAFDNGAEDRILRNYTEGGIFGELALLFRSPRAATLRVSSSTSSGASLWKFSVKDYDAIVKGNARVAETALKAIERDSSYKTYLEMRQLEAAMRKCKVFRHFTHEDLERSMNVMEKVTFTNGTNIIQQGDVGDAMYFVQSGTAVCIQEKTGEVLSEIGPGGHFGELALLFDQPRAVTVRAKANDGEDMVVWKLNSNAFNEATQDYSLGEKALELLKEKFHSKTLLTTLRRMSFGEAMDLLRSCSRPKKKNVSLHSVISSLYAGMFVLAM
jgi:CRP-like cAMP-binding protein